MAGLLDDLDPKVYGLMQAGLQILANNGMMRPGQAIAGGLLGGMNSMQDFQRQKMMDGYRQQQFDMQKQQADMQQQEFGWKKKQYDDEQTAIAQASQLHPELGPLFRLNSAAAIKAAYPQANGADPYFSSIATENGLIVFDHRTGKYYGADGKPINVSLIKSSDSPIVRGAVKGAEAEAAANWNPNNMIEGQVLTDAQVSQMARGGMPPSNINTPYPVTFGAPGTTATDMREGTATDASVALRDPSNPRVGIQVPTEAEKAARKKQAEIIAEDRAKTQTGIGQVIAQGQETIKLVDELLAHPGFTQAVGTSSYLDPRNIIPGTDAKSFNIRLDQLKGKQFLQAFETLKGGGQITEVEGRKATDAISRMNTSASEDEFVTAAREFQGVIRQGMDRAQNKVGIAPTQQPSKPRSKADILKQYGVR